MWIRDRGNGRCMSNRASIQGAAIEKAMLGCPLVREKTQLRVRTVLGIITKPGANTGVKSTRVFIRNVRMASENSVNWDNCQHSIPNHSSHHRHPPRINFHPKRDHNDVISLRKNWFVQYSQFLYQQVRSYSP